MTVGTIATPERKKLMDFAYIMWAEPYAMVVSRPEEESRLFTFLRPFTTTVTCILNLRMGLCHNVIAIRLSILHTDYGLSQNLIHSVITVFFIEGLAIYLCGLVAMLLVAS